MNISKKIRALSQLLDLQAKLDTKGDIYKRGRCGICGYVPEFNLISYFVTWKHFSGNGAFPIPDLHTGSITIFYDSKDEGTMWQGEYGALRRELLDHIIKQLKQELRRSPRYWVYRIYKEYL